ncbi:putative quinol monooxygenase [Glycomyces tenuis]|uniref:putative quinol monooxygenase n=1 Tax=Glycomyces tenuis TaxID=58116 RepID=UPI00041E4405|nr:putative quinol monooxygenase [Glycomyces tenuis]
MIVVHVSLYSRPEHRASFARALRRLQAATLERDAGCLRYDCSVDLADADRFTCVEQWTDMDSVRAHLEAPHHLEADALLDRWRARPAEVRLFTAEPAEL